MHVAYVFFVKEGLLTMEVDLHFIIIAYRSGGSSYYSRYSATILCVLLLFLSSSQNVFAKNFYVSTNGDDKNIGILTNPFRTLAKAAEMARAGDSVFIREGVYKERLELRNSGQPQSYVTFQRYKQESVVIDATGFRQGIILYDVSYVRVKGLEIRHSTHAGIHIHHHMDKKDNGSDYNIIEGNTVLYCGSAGYSGVYIGGDHNQIIDNIYLKNGRHGAKPRDHGIYIFGNNNIVARNYVAYNARNGIRMEGENNQVHANVLMKNGESGMSVWVDAPLKGKNITISKNIIIDNPKYGIVIDGAGSGEKPYNIKIYNNTIRSEMSKVGMRVVNGSESVKIINNIVMGKFSKAVLETDPKSTKGYEENYNIFYSNGAFYYKGLYCSDLESYKAKSSFGRNSFSDNPALQADFSLGKNSIAQEKGMNVGIPFAGKRPSIGAKDVGEIGIKFTGMTIPFIKNNALP